VTRLTYVRRWERSSRSLAQLQQGREDEGDLVFGEARRAGLVRPTFDKAADEEKLGQILSLQ